MNIQGVIMLEKELKKISALHCQVRYAPVQLKTAWLFPLLLCFSLHSTCGKPAPGGPRVLESPGAGDRGCWIPRALQPKRGACVRAGPREGAGFKGLCRMDPWGPATPCCSPDPSGWGVWEQSPLSFSSCHGISGTRSHWSHWSHYSPSWSGKSQDKFF